MQVLIAFAVVGWIMSLPWMAILVSLIVLLLALGVGSYVVLNTDDCLRMPSRKRVTIDPSYIAALKTLVAEAEAELTVLRDEVAQLRAASRAAESGATQGTAARIHRRVGLADNAPDWLVTAARRAYRSRLHPDRHPAPVKAEAERRYIEAEGIFEQINALRF